MSRRYDTERLAALASKNELTRETKRTLFEEMGAFIHHGILLVVCLLKRTAQGDEEGTPRLVTAKEFARITTLSEKTIYRDARVGKLKCVRQGRRVMFPSEELDRYRRMQTRDTPQLPLKDSKTR